MSEPVDPTRVHIAWRGALLAAALNAFGSPLELIVGRDVPGLPHWPPIAAGAIGLVLLALLLLGRHRPSRAGAAIAFLVNTASVVAMLWINNAHWAQLGAHWAPFQANKLGALTVGLLTPEIAVGVISIVAYAGSAVVHFALFAPSVRAELARGEPLTTCIFTLFGLIILVFARRRYAIERRLVQREHDAAALEQLARALLAVRDFANTPLQTIETATALARLQHPDAGTQLQRIERALDRLRGLNRLLSRHEANIRWRPGDESFDAIEELARGPDGDDGKPAKS
jgi:hypothetical protein